MLHNPLIFHKLFTLPKPIAKLRRTLLNMTDSADSFITSQNSARRNFRALSSRACAQTSGSQFSQKFERIKEGLEHRALCCEKKKRHLLSTDTITLLQLKGSHYTFFQGHSTSKPKIYLPDSEEKNKGRCFWQKKCGCSKEFRIHRMEKICHRIVPKGSRSTGPPSGRAWLPLSISQQRVAISARKINTETEGKISEYKEVRIGIVYSNCTVATVQFGNSVH